MNGEKMSETRPYELHFINRKGLIIKTAHIWADNKKEANAIGHEWALRIKPLPYSKLIVNCLPRISA